jgi:hypothetical protein
MGSFENFEPCSYRQFAIYLAMNLILGTKIWGPLCSEYRLRWGMIIECELPVRFGMLHSMKDVAYVLYPTPSWQWVVIYCGLLGYDMTWPWRSIQFMFHNIHNKQGNKSNHYQPLRGTCSLYLWVGSKVGGWVFIWDHMCHYPEDHHLNTLHSLP